MQPGSGHAAASAIGSVLIVDDSVVQRNHCAELCRALGIARVLEAGNGREALELLRALTPAPDLLIVDLEMPAMDGAELIERLREGHLDIPILVVSARDRALVDSMQDLGQALGMRVIGALPKPLTARALLALLRRRETRAPAHPGTPLPLEPAELDAALERGEIVAHFEPQVDSASAAVCGVEALARWHHPRFGWVPPDQFVPLAERSGLIRALTLQMMRQALLQACVWNTMGHRLTVSINLSPTLLERTDLVDDLTCLQQSFGLPAERLTLEVTETGVMRELGTALAVLTRLRLRGFGLSLDDYGTGFSSLQQLARIPFTELKIDRTFVHGFPAREKLQVVLHSALQMAGELGLVSVAEGVEELAEWRLLRQFGCRRAQGWMFTRALPALEFSQWLDAYRPQALLGRSGAAHGSMRAA